MGFVGTMNRFHKRDVVCTTPYVRKQITDPGATLTVLSKLPRTFQKVTVLRTAAAGRGASPEVAYSRRCPHATARHA